METDRYKYSYVIIIIKFPSKLVYFKKLAIVQPPKEKQGIYQKF